MPDAPKPAIVAPMSRHIIVADVPRSLAFYRDILGFEVKPVQADHGLPAVAEVVHGPARIQLGSKTDEAARDRAVLFFETDDVRALHEQVKNSGAQPSDIDTVNGIEMQMFEVRDPDGHTLWFGQARHEAADEAASAAKGGQLRQVMPNMPMSDVHAGVAYYRDVLGFTVNYEQDDLGVMDRDEVRIVLVARTEKFTGIGSCYVYVRDVDALHDELRGKGANVLDEPLSMPWGLRQFHMLDSDGNEITFGQPFE
jgi:catechol 2,3-dioxygenase-like lactoylglutathione lyase family enzyme